MNRAFHSSSRAPRGTGGFALVVTISILTLMALIAIGLLALSSVSTRTANDGAAQAEARANARLALILALGELQKHAGSDRRVSAPAGILDSSPGTRGIDGVNHPHWVGIWDSWTAGNEAHGADETSEHRTIIRQANAGLHPTYEKDRADHFRSWLVSLSDKDAAAMIGSARDTQLEGVVTPTADHTGVRLVGAGSLGPDPQDDQFVTAGLLDLDTDGHAGTPRNGRYGWWVSDESTKARIMADRFATGDLTKGRLLARALSAGSTGHDLIDALAAANDPDKLRRTVSRGSLAFSVEDPEKARGTFHDTTLWSRGVLADVREGGLKQDLSALLERPIRISDRQDRFMLYRFDNRGEERVPLADLAAYYQLYRTQVKYTGRLARSVVHINNPDFNTDGGSRSDSEFKREYSNLYRMPVPIKIQFLLSYKGVPRTPTRTNRSRYKLHLGITPAITLWNPYNVPLILNHGDAKSTQIRFFNLPIALRWTKNGSSGAYRSQRPTSLSWITNRDRYGGGVFRGGGGDRHTGFEVFFAGRNQIRFEPGEVRVFSLKQATNDGTASAYLGDTNTYREEREVDPGWDPNGFIELPRSDRNRNDRHIEPGRGVGGNNDDGIGGALTFDPGDEISFTVSAAENVDLANGAALQFFCRQSDTVLRGEGGGDDNKWMRRQYQLISRLHSKNSTTGRTSERARAHYRKLMEQGFPDQAGEIDFPPLRGAEMIGAHRPFLLVSLTAACETFYETAGDARGRRFPTRPFLHSTPINACPFVDRDDPDSFYHHSWNWWVQDINSVLEASVQVDENNRNSFYGGGYTPDYGTTHCVQQEIPLIPLHSIGALSHARLGGYSLANNSLGPTAGATRNDSYQRVTATGARGLFPHVVQAIGNSYAHPYLKPDQAHGRWQRHYSAEEGREAITMVDHSYLANKALWDDYFFSSIAPRTVRLYEGDENVSARQVAEDFFFGEKPLPNERMTPYAHTLDPATLKSYFHDDLLNLTGADEIASRLLVKGAFNVNSTSVDAWRALFASLRGRSVASLELGKSLERSLPLTESDQEGTPVSGFAMANGTPLEGSPVDPDEPGQWHSWRELTDDEIDELAEAMVRQVKRRGPFLSLSEFVNRRLDSNDPELAVKGALQAALDDEDVSINEGFRSPDRRFSDTETRNLKPEFPEALEGPIAYGSSAYIDQADLLRSLGAQLTPRGDSFVIRTYGDSLDANGSVRARAWCEAVVQRVPELLDRSSGNGDPDKPHAKYDELASGINRRFGRPLRVVAFRWLAPGEV